MPNEILLLIISRIEAKGLIKCMKVCRRLRALISDNWFRLPRPTIELGFWTHTKEKWKFEVDVNTHVDPEHPDVGLRKFEGFYENGTLSVEWMKHCEELERFRESLGKKGFSVKNKMSLKLVRTCIRKRCKGFRFEVSSLSWEEALEAFVPWILDFRYRTTLQDGSAVELATKLRELVRDQPNKLEKLITHDLMGAMHEMLPMTQEQEVRFYREEETEINPYALVAQATDLKPYNCLSASSTAHVLRQEENIAHSMKGYMFGAEGGELPEYVGMTNATVIRIEVNRGTSVHIPEVLRILLKQWNDGLRIIKRLIFDPATIYGIVFDKDYRLDIANVLHDYRPERLAATEECPERYLLHSTTTPVKHILIHKQMIPRDRSVNNVAYFEYVFTECVAE